MPLRRFVLCVLLAASAAAPRCFSDAPATPSAVAPAGYEARLGDAKHLATEGSWAPARDAYAEALKLASSDDARRWCELWLEDATWRAEGQPQDWQAARLWMARHEAAFERLLGPYTKGRPRDDFWAAATETRGAFLGRGSWWRPALDSWHEVATFLGEQPCTAAASDRLVGFLQRVLGDRERGHEEFAQFLPLLERGIEVGNTPDQRAWCALTLARFEGGASKERAMSWKRAMELANGTKWAPLACALDFLWRSEVGWHPGVPVGSAVDVPALLREASSLREALEHAPAEVSSKDVVGLLRQFEQRLAAPILNVQGAARFLPGDAMSFVYGAAGFDRLEVEIYEHTPESWGRWELEPKGNALERVARRIRTWTIALPAAAELRWKSEVVALSPRLPAGLYTLAVHGMGETKEETQRVDFVVSDRGGVMESDADGGRTLFLFSQGTRAPVAGKHAEGVVVDANGARSWSGTTDVTGRIDLSGAKEPKRTRADIRMVAVVEGQPVPIASWVWNSGRADQLVADFFLDRALYRPGETVKWKVIVRERRDGSWLVPKENLEMGVILNDEPLVEKMEVELNRFGTAHGEIAIPASARPGETEVELKSPRDSARSLGRQSFFTVDNFVPPALVAKVELASGADSLRPGREMIVRVTATYLSGGPAVGAHAQLKTAIVAGPARPAPFGDQPQFDQWVSKVNAEEREGVTGADGAAEFRLRLPDRIPGALQLNLAAAVIPEGGQTVHAAAGWQVTTTGRVLDVEDWTATRLVPLERPVDFACVVRNGAGEPAPFSGVAQLVERRWVGLYLNPQGAVVDRPPAGAEESIRPWNPEPLLPVGWTTLHADYVETVVADKPVEVASDGKLQVEFTPPRPGLCRLKVLDDSGEVPLYPATGFWEEKPLTIVAADDKTRALPLAPSIAAVYAPKRVRVGEPVTALVVLPEGETSAVVTIAGENETVSRRVDFQGRAGLVTFNEWPRCAGHGSIAVATLKGGDRNTRAEFAVDQDRGLLRVKASVDSENPRPGATSRIALEVHPATGTETPSEAAVAVSDEAVNGLMGRPTQEEIIFARPGMMAEPRFGVSPAPSPWKPVALPDPRRGTVVFFGRGGAGGGGAGDEVVTLSPFLVEAGGDGGYQASATLAGSRVRTDLRDVGSAVSVVTAAYLRDTGSGNSKDFLAYTTDAEATGVQGDFAAKPDAVIEIRRHFSSTAAWVPEIVADAKGEAAIEFKYPDNLTRWRIEAYAVGADGSTFGRTMAFTRTSLPFQARLQLPRFLVVGDTAEPSAVLVNRTDSGVYANAELKLRGTVEAKEPAKLAQTGIEVPKQGEAHTGWAVKAVQSGEANFTLTARAGAEGDAMELPVPVLEDGTQQETAASGRLAPGAATLVLRVPLPQPLDPARTRVTVQLSPSHATAILDALPYLVDYPYGCVEQTMSRFLPAIVVRKTLADFGMSVADIERRILSRESKADATRREKTAGLGKLDAVVQQSLARLTEAQRDDGGFGWWPDAPSADLWMTAYVAWGLELARTAGINPPPRLAGKTYEALVRFVASGVAFSDTAAWALAALAKAERDEIDAKAVGEAFQRCYDARTTLSAAGRACLALAAAKFGTDTQRAVLLRNLENGAQRVRADDLGDTVHWGSTGGYWRATDGAVESTALTLLALLELDPKHPFVEPAANWLALNRRSAHWASTRDTAFAVLALARYVSLRGEAKSDAAIELFANGNAVRRMKLTRESLLEGPLTMPLEPAVLRPGDNQLELRRVAGNAPVYIVAMASSWAQSDAVKPAGLLIEVARGFTRQKTQPTLAGTLRITPEPLGDRGAAMAGEQVTAKVTLMVPNELEYVMVEVPKPAGCEPLNPLSGWDARLLRVDTNQGSSVTSPSLERTADDDEASAAAPGRAIYREEHDDRSVFFLDHVEAGMWEIHFGLRATTPGDYRVLPVEASAMYVPEVRANSDARRIQVQTPGANQFKPQP